MVQRHIDFAITGGKGLPVVLFGLVVLQEYSIIFLGKKNHSICLYFHQRATYCLGSTKYPISMDGWIRFSLLEPGAGIGDAGSFWRRHARNRAGRKDFRCESVYKLHIWLYLVDV